MDKQFYESSKSMGHISHDSNTGVVTKTERELNPLKRCECGTGTNNNECAWCRIVARVGYDMSDCREVAN